MTKIFPFIFRALLVLGMIYSLNAVAAEVEAPVKSETSVTKSETPQSLQNIPPEILAKIPADELVSILHMQMKSPKTLSESVFDKQIIVPGMVFGSFVAMVYFIAFYSYRKRQDLLSLVREGIKSGHPLPEGFMDSLEYKRKPTAESDIRKALLLIALGFSSIVIIFFVADPAQKSMAALGVLPLLTGFAYLFLWKYGQSKTNSEQK